MCGRFIQATASAAFAEQFGVDYAPQTAPRYNVAPSQPVFGIRAGAGGLEGVWLRWGLIPAWAAEPKMPYRTINARAETVAEKPTYRQAFRQRRCLIPADGFYEWQKTGNGKHQQPYGIGLASGEPLAFAGLWERWERDGQAIESCTLVVTVANARIAPIHDRMPVILDPADYATWLNPALRDPASLTPLLRSYPAERMRAWPVGPAINHPRNEGPALMAAVPVQVSG